MRKGKWLTEGEITLAIDQFHGRRALFVSRPPHSQHRLAPELPGVLQMSFDSSGLCPPDGECTKPGSKGRSCSDLYDILVVPLKDGISDDDALRLGHQVRDASFTLFRLEADKKRDKLAADRARHSSASERVPHRAFGPARTQGRVGQRK